MCSYIPHLQQQLSSANATASQQPSQAQRRCGLQLWLHPLHTCGTEHWVCPHESPPHKHHVTSSSDPLPPRPHAPLATQCIEAHAPNAGQLYNWSSGTNLISPFLSNQFHRREQCGSVDLSVSIRSLYGCGLCYIKLDYQTLDVWSKTKLQF